MSFGLRVTSANNVVQIDTSKRYLRVVAVINYTFQLYIYEIAVAVPGFSQDGSWFAMCRYTDINTGTQFTLEHKIYVAADNYVGVMFGARQDYNLNDYASTGVLTIYRL